MSAATAAASTAAPVFASSKSSGALQLRARGRWDDKIPPALRPLVRAYLLGYASAVAPRVLTLLLQHPTRWKHAKKLQQRQKTQQNDDSFLDSLGRILRGGLDPRRFPTFCAALVGGSTLLENPIRIALDKLSTSLSDVARKRLSRWFASFLAAWLSLQLLQSKQSPGFTEKAPVQTDSPPVVAYQTTRYAGRTLDLTLFALARALDVVAGELWARRKARRRAVGRWTALESSISQLADPAIFTVSSGLVMWTWIYLPSRLPRSYNKWIGSAAAVDPRLIEALQRCRTGELVYGQGTGQGPLLGAMCDDYHWPRAWGDPAVSVPFPCEVVHMGTGPSCEYHAFSRFMRSFRWAMATYLPLSLLLALRKPNLQALRGALVSASRSSAFLGAFIALFYYGVCLARTRVGPHIVGTDAKARQCIDGGICVGTGCALCGWSILIEVAGRRKDMALFVAPRAMATLLPRRYGWDKQWRETAVFAASTAVVFTCVLENKERVRGVLGKVLGSVLRA
ncbi:integral membrane protein [Immersiella caudata]|uniref:Integral membrane protein n=1 Tax=Immersiella caudata TaxID=314043 RepID=A0AA40C6J5_9PEZI|nr:integral membrane protein [Immersiella caudata]